MDVNNNSSSMKLKVKCDLCEIGNFLSKDMHFCHLGVERLKEKKSWEIRLQPSENDNVKCLDCQNIFSTIDSAKIHYKTQHFDVKTYKNCKCQVCAKYFENNTKLRRHMQKKHNSNGWKIKDVGTNKKLFKKSVVKPEKMHGLPVENLGWKELKQNQDGHFMPKLQKSICWHKWCYKTFQRAAYECQKNSV
jgi:hypothetical protein